MARRRFATLVAAAWLAGCERPADVPSVEPAGSGSSSLALPERPPAPREGMVWIGKGALVAGSALDDVPRAPDREMNGEQVVLSGFFIDRLPFPNEEGAIPMTNVTRQEAEDHCADLDKRLCSELEWERACKGPENLRFERGDVYQVEPCGIGSPPALRPSGLAVGCTSGFGVRDLHGGVFEWTRSPWGRGGATSLGVLRGGNGVDGELVGRCAYADPFPIDRKSGDVGFRCCAGPVNTAEVTLRLRPQGPAFEPLARWSMPLAARLIAELDATARKQLGDRPFTVDRAWNWRPMRNEQLVVLGGCAGFVTAPSCGVLVGREQPTGTRLLAWASTDGRAPTGAMDRDPATLHLTGTDASGGYTRRVRYEAGRVRVGEKERLLERKKKKNKK